MALALNKNAYEPPRRRSASAASVIVALTTLLFVWPLAWSRFPLAYWDTSEYLWRWAVVRPGFDRPIF